jgi:hypothetical protein
MQSDVEITAGIMIIIARVTTNTHKVSVGETYHPTLLFAPLLFIAYILKTT